MKYKADITKAKDNSTKDKKHQVLNTISGLIIISVIIFVAIVILKVVLDIICNFITVLSETASKLDAVIIVALITGSISLIGVIISSIVSKYIEYKKSREAYLAQKREKPYGDFVEMVYKVQQNGKTIDYGQEEMIKDILSFSKELTLWGSPKVAAMWVKFRGVLVTQTDPKENLYIMEDIMNEMRKDLGTKRIKEGKLLAFFINDIDEPQNKRNKKQYNP